VLGDILSDHFPPRLVFETSQVRASHKSRLIIEARARADLGDKEGACLLFNQAAYYERVLMTEPLSPMARGVREVSEATCYGLAGDLPRARALLDAARPLLDADATAFRGRLDLKHRRESRVAIAMKAAFEAYDLHAVVRVRKRAYGLLPVRVLYWPEYWITDQQERWAEARTALEKLIVAMPQRATFHILHATALRDHALELASEYCAYARSAFPRDVRLLATEGSVALALGDLDRAHRSAEAAIAQWSEAPVAVPGEESFASLAFIVSAAAFRRRNAYAEAIAVAKRGTQALPRDAELATMAGILLLATGRKEEAFETFSRAAGEGRRKTHWPATFGGALAIELERWQEARSLLESAVRMARGSILAKNLTNLGVLHAIEGRIDDARASFERAVQVDPALESARRNLEAVERGTPVRAADLQGEWERFEVVAKSPLVDEDLMLDAAA